MRILDNMGWVLFWGLYIWCAVNIGGVFQQRGVDTWTSYKLGIYWPIVIREMAKPLEKGELYEY